MKHLDQDEMSVQDFFLSVNDWPMTNGMRFDLCMAYFGLHQKSTIPKAAEEQPDMTSWVCTPPPLCAMTAAY